MRSKKAILGVMATAMFAAIAAVVIVATPPAQADGATQPKTAPAFGAMPGAAQNLLLRQDGSGDDAQITVTFDDGSPNAVTHRVIRTSYGRNEATVATFTAGDGPYAYTFEDPNSQQKYEFEVVSDLPDDATASTGAVEFATNNARPPAAELVQAAAYRTANIVRWQHPPFNSAADFRDAGYYQVHRQVVNSDGSLSGSSMVFSRATNYYHHPEHNAGETRGQQMGPCFTDQDVTAGTTYRYHVKLRDGSKNSFASNAAQTTALAETDSAPTGVSYFRDQNSVTIEWYSDPEFAYSAFEVEVTLRPDDEQKAQTTTHTVDAAGQDMSFTLETPGPRVGINFRIRGVSSRLGTQKNPNVDPNTPEGQSVPFRGAWTGSIDAQRMSRPSQPAAVSVTATQDGNRISWEMPENTPEDAAIQSWTVHREAAPASSAADMTIIAREIPASTTSFTDANPPAGEMMYSLRSVSVNNVNSFPTEPQAVIRPPAGAPRNASATPDLDAEGYAISWQAPEGGTEPSGYLLAFTHDGTNQSVRLDADATGYVDQQLDDFPYQRRAYRLTTVYEQTAGNERVGGYTTFRAQALPMPPENVDYRLGFRGLVVSWDQDSQRLSRPSAIVRRPADDPDAEWADTGTSYRLVSRDGTAYRQTGTVQDDGGTAYVYSVRTANEWASAYAAENSEAVTVFPSGGRTWSVDGLSSQNSDDGVKITWSEHLWNDDDIGGFVIGRAQLSEGQQVASTSDYRVVGTILFDPPRAAPDDFTMPTHEYVDENAASGARYQYGVATLDSEGRIKVRNSARTTVTAD